MDKSTSTAWTWSPQEEDDESHRQSDDPNSTFRLKAVDSSGTDFHQFVEDTQDPSVLINTERKIVAANRGAEMLFAALPGALVGVPVDSLLAPQLSSTPSPRVGQRRTSAAPRRFSRLDGTTFHGMTVGGPVRDHNGTVSGQLLILRDISRDVAAEKALQRLHAITTDRKLTFQERLLAILELGAKHFELSLGILSRIDGETYEVVRAIAAENPPEPGAKFDLGSTYCVHTLKAKGPLGFHHAGASAIHDHPCYQTFHLESYLGAPISVNGKPYGTLNFSSPVPTRPFTDQDLELIRLFADWAGNEIERDLNNKRVEQARQQLEKEASTDHLTSVLNRRALGERLDHEISRSLRYGHPLSVIIVDLDHFKKVNDTYGHLAGDEVLRAFSATCARTIRDIDAVGRWGGEEFLLILPATNESKATICAERLRKAVEALEVDVDGETVNFTISLGVSDLRRGLTKSTLLLSADQALYLAKEQGRNRWCTRDGNNGNKSET